MDFAVIIPAHDDEACIAAAIASVLPQPGLAEVIVVDDGSTDRTAEVAGATGDPRVTVVTQANQGPAAARNRGIETATASHLVFLDSDDWLLPDALERFGALHEAGHAMARTGARREVDDGTVSDFLAAPTPFLYPAGCPLAGSFSIERRVLEAIGGYDPRFHYGENSELLLRAEEEIQRGGDTTGCDPTPTVHVRSRGGRPADFYTERRRAATELMLEVHGERMRPDRANLADHHAIAAYLERNAGNRRAARSHALGVVRARPTSLRSWARLVRYSV